MIEIRKKTNTLLAFDNSCLSVNEYGCLCASPDESRFFKVDGLVLGAGDEILPYQQIENRMAEFFMETAADVDTQEPAPEAQKDTTGQFDYTADDSECVEDALGFDFSMPKPSNPITTDHILAVLLYVVFVLMAILAWTNIFIL